MTSTNTLSQVNIQRQSLAWFLVVQIFIIAPHFISAPKWIVLLWAVIAIWRWKIFQGAWGYPSRLHKTILVGAGIGGLLLTMGAHFSFESMVSLLLVGFVLKLLEVKQRRDLVLLIFIALFILAAQFIQFNHFVAAFYGIFCLILLCSVLMQLYCQTELQSVFSQFKTNLFVLLQAIPFMVLMFVVVPRVGSFWAVPSPQHAKTGMSDSMSPGDFAELTESNELAFHVIFHGKPPSRENLYWRSLVFSSFNGRRWTQSPEQMQHRYFNQADKKLQAHVSYAGDPVSYDIIAEPSNRLWLYTLAAPETWSPNVGFARDLRLQAFLPVNERMMYSVTSRLDYRLSEVDQSELQINLRLPEAGNAKTRDMARQWKIKTGSTEKLIEKLLAYFHQSFFYTLKPPALGVDVVDEFLWGTRQGFCEHFASSFVFFMRAAGVPARVIVGYQGGDINSIDGSISVRQKDAHAWAEVWLEDKGWVMIDPTAAVAPERVRKGIEQSLSATDQQFLARPLAGSFAVLSFFRERWEVANYQWTRWVLSYDSTLQAQFLEKVLGDVTPLRLAAMVVGGGTLIGMMIFGVLLIRRPSVGLTEHQLIFKKLCKKLKPLGFEPRVGESPQMFLTRVASVRGDLTDLQLVGQLYEQFTYADDSRIKLQLQKAVWSLKLNRK